MATKDKGSPPEKVQRSPKTGGVIIEGGTVRVWSEVGVSIPIGDTYAHLRFSFGHERLAKSSSQEEIRKTAALVDEFNEAELERRVIKYRRLVNRVLNGDDDEEESEEERPKKKGKGSARERARKRLRE